MELAVSEKTAAVSFEPMQGEAGVIIPPQDYLKRVRNTCPVVTIFARKRTAIKFVFQHRL